MQIPQQFEDPLQPEIQQPLHRQGGTDGAEHGVRGSAAVRVRRRHGLRLRHKVRGTRPFTPPPF